MKATLIALLTVFFCAVAGTVYADAPPKLPEKFIAEDFPGDKGEKIRIMWAKSSDDGAGENDVKTYYLFRSTAKDGNYEIVEEFTPLTEDVKVYEDKNLPGNINYYYQLKIVDAQNNISFSEKIGPVAANPEWFNVNRNMILIGMLLYIAIVLVCILLAKRGKDFFVRKIAGLDAVDEAIGRATEMGKPILYVTGLGGLGDIATLASINILGRLAKKIAEYETPLIVPAYDYFVMMVQKEVVKEAYMEAGRPDSYKDDSVFFLSDSQFAYAAAVDGIMVREKPAANFYLGTFFAESLILAETGASTGAIQIAGTDALAQIPFFITACDYTLIGEELYAASAYLSREPLVMGTLKSQDWGKLILMILIIIGIALVSFGIPFDEFFRVIE
ncbi:MAG: hypothetical protein HZA48_00685 [Planctomycetes bacterium]|nr:hypothetical protein [Planctomycetota bacterium]